jgi:hypothetical protein
MKVTVTFTLIPRQHLPPGFDDLLEDLQRVVLGLLVAGELQDRVDPRPCIRVFLQRRQNLLSDSLLQ